MGVQKRIPWLFSLGLVLAAMALWGTRAGADVVSDRPGSVVIWPKVIADGTRDTIIKLTNTTNLQVFAHCEYVVGSGFCSLTPQFCSRTSPLGGGSPDCTQFPGVANQCVLNWQTSDFDVILTRQQPTFWRVSTGRVDNPFLPDNGQCITFTDGPTLRQSCPGLFPVGMVPPPAVQATPPFTGPGPFFRGELKCIQVNEDGSPNTANALKGEAIIETLGSNQISEYSAINVIGNETPASSPLELNGISYNACPEAVEFTHYARGASDLVAADLGAPCVGGCPVRTEITLIPCREDFENETPIRFVGNFNIWDDFEQFQSTELPFNCWVNLDLTALGFNPASLNGTTFNHTRVTSSGTGLCIAGSNLNVPCASDAACGTGGVCGPVPGLLGIVEQFHENDLSLPPPGPPFPRPNLINVGVDAANGYTFDANGDGSIQRLGRCRQALTTRCSSDDQCPVGRCRVATTVACSAVANADCVGAGDPEPCCTGAGTGTCAGANCGTTNVDCVAAGNPATCCTGAGTGTCAPIPGDFCDQCMNDEILIEDSQIMQNQ